MIKLSCILAGIRPGNWLRLYDSIASSFSGTWELVIVSPYYLPLDIRNKPNVKLIRDFGSPVRCMDIGLEHCEGEYITWAADDGYFLPGALDISMSILEGNEKNVVIGKYYEGAGNNPLMNSSAYYYVNYHDSSRSKFIDNNCMMVMEGVVPAKAIREAGGWDASLFEVCPMAFCDLSVRLFNMGYVFIVQPDPMFKCSHMPGHEGDHGPVHDGQTQHDEPTFKSIYNQPESVNRKEIPIDNWKQAPERWARRFGNG